MHSPALLPAVVSEARKDDPRAAPELTRPVIPYGAPGPGGTEITSAKGARGRPEDEHLVTYAPHSALWIDLPDTDTRAAHPRGMAECVLGSAYRVWTNMRRANAVTPSARHPGQSVPSNEPVSCRFRQWRSLRDAIHGHDVEGLRGMLASGCDANERGSDGYCPLHVAVRFGGELFVAALLEARASINIRTEDGDTALHQVSKTGSEPVAELLMAAGADSELKNKKGWTPVQLATFHGHKGLVGVILGGKVPMAERGPGVWPGEALGQQHPLARADQGPAAIPFKSGFEDQQEHEHTPTEQPPQHGHRHKHGHGHGHEHEEEPEEEGMPGFALRGEQRSPGKAHRPIPAEAEPVAGPESERVEGSGEASANPCYVINYAQSDSFYHEQQAKRVQERRDAFWFKYSI